ncbi:hypothetical protein [Mycobacterium sp. E2733]|uniref:hypothetical protein n=1 Tax=Mycobacterium sp. E2733 TaxID=1834138 RepID=UPI000801F429|nr:hypothetical protein [Mycobacterium sp. E2733]OBH94288.1 hypothetical protein A5678_04485 [Mycobacterium sp. E2733]
MEQVVPVGINTVLEQLHQHLDTHFRALAEARRPLGTDIPVFALEHGLDAIDLDKLHDAVRAAVAQGFPIKYKKWWLPFVVYAAELGYRYVGGEYWQTFEDETPRWDEVGDRDWIGYKFIEFADKYGGVRPRGAFARHFSIIAWPITHAVLPIYLQRNLAQLLFDFRSALTSDLLNDPEALGARLASRTSAFTERFRIFCENTALLGSVAAALLGEGDESPYLLPSTQQRLVESLSRESESRRWLTSARQAASRVRAKGFRAPAKATSTAPSPAAGRVSPPQPTDPKLQLRRDDGQWQLYAALPDLTPIGARLPEVIEELRGRRAIIDGVEGPPLARGRLLFPGQSVRLARWPRAEAPFVQLVGAPAQVNRLLADQCVVRGGPVWLFRQRMRGLADEVKGRVVRPGQTYNMILGQSAPMPDIPWAEETAVDISGMRSFVLRVPDQLSDAEQSALVAIGISVVTDLAVQPVGVVASAWDGEGGIEWLAGERAAIAIISDIDARRLELTLGGMPYTVDWLSGQRELFLQFDDLAVGTHELGVRLFVTDESPAAAETLFITIRDPQVRPEGATAAEAVRLLASPARPTLADLWDGRASLSIEGPPTTMADLRVSLRSENGSQLAQIQRSVELPVGDDVWPEIAKQIRGQQRFQAVYDDAESVEIAISRAGIGFAALVCDRGYSPLRWRVTRQHGNGFHAFLVDRTDGTSTRVELFTVDDPLRSVPHDRDAIISVPPLGGLLRATADGGAKQSIVMPTQPNEVRRAGLFRPRVHTSRRSPQEIVRLAEGYRMWDEAELPADPFAQNLQARVLEAITHTSVSLICGTYWSAVERRLIDADDPIHHIGDLQKAVGVGTRKQTLAGKIAHHLWEWSSPGALLAGFTEVITPALERRGLAGMATAPRFLLLLAGRLGLILDWDPAERDKILAVAMESTWLLRAARLAVLGSRTFMDADEAAKGF